MTRLRAAVALIAALTIAGADPGCAEDDGDWTFTLSAGAGFTPDYEGSDSLEFIPLGSAKIGWNHRYATLRGSALQVNVINNPVWHFGPILRYRFGRDGADDALVDRLRDVDDSFEVGAFIAYNLLNGADPRYGLTLGLEVSQDVMGGHEGFLARVSATYRKPFGKQFFATLGGSLGYADDTYMDAYFDIDANNSARSGLPVFDAEGALKDASLKSSLTYFFTRQWSVTGLLSYTRLLADAAASPVVADRGSVNQLFGALFVSYKF